MMKTNAVDIHFESEHKVFLDGEVYAGAIRGLLEPASFKYEVEPAACIALSADELRAIADKLDTLNNVNTDEEIADDWVAWEGGTCPTADSVLLEVKYRNGLTSQGEAWGWLWGHQDKPYDIVAYRVIND